MHTTLFSVLPTVQVVIERGADDGHFSQSILQSF